MMKQLFTYPHGQMV